MAELVDIANLIRMAEESKAAFRTLSNSSNEARSIVLEHLSDSLVNNNHTILEANKEDYSTAKANGMSDAMLDRLLLDSSRLQAIAKDLKNISKLDDPIGETIETRLMDNGLSLEKRRVPLGVIASIYESRPNVTVDISALCLKSGNTCLMRGGSESINSNLALVDAIHSSLLEAGLPQSAVQYISNPDRSLVTELLGLKDHVDLLIPRGGDSLIRFVSENASMPVVTGGIGVCHTYVDAGADIDMARAIIINAKVQRPTVCNALDTILVHTKIAPQLLPLLGKDLSEHQVELHCDQSSLEILRATSPDIILKEAVHEDWGKEFLSLVAAVKIVDSVDSAIDHIAIYGSGHSDAIVTEDNESAVRFLNEVDSCAVYLNASTRFTDGAEFGMGAEVGISTQKFHARGPMGLRELTSYKWLIRGTGQIRG
ncbi:MAG: glutamate-5-semialdehyde dehydrogenase [Dehalococcoidia bacterium]|nr:glutamate-5-semialdehyde dehydrogenase [Dehalococcoidia bacterium]|tara:strand:+ start:4933 stop:6216 length:1284 start_codon:yes stop_codon:yes gene_type:complete